MKVQKISLKFKIGPAQIKDISSYKFISANEDEMYISRNNKRIQSISGVSRAYSNRCAEARLPRTCFLNPAYSKKNNHKNINRLKNFTKKTSPRLSSAIKDKTTDFPSDIRQEKIKKAKTRLEQGYYSRSKVYSKVAEQIINELI